MPFQDIEDARATEVADRPSTLERLARKIFLEDLSLKLLALGITLVVWFAVTSENTPVTITSEIQLNFIRPANLEISNDPPRTVNVLLTGSRNKLNSISSVDLVATVDITDFRAGERVIRLSPRRVLIPLPDGVTLESFEPSTIQIRLEPRIERQIPVEARLEGKPAEGFELYQAQSTPGSVRIQGPASRVNELQRAPTETVSLEGRKEDFSIPDVSIDIGDHKIEALDPVVNLTVQIGERRVERSFENVEVRSSNGAPVLPSVATITLSGPARAVEQLHAEEILIIVEKSGDNSKPQLQLPSGAEQVRLISIKPTIFQ